MEGRGTESGAGGGREGDVGGLPHPPHQAVHPSPSTKEFPIGCLVFSFIKRNKGLLNPSGGDFRTTLGTRRKQAQRGFVAVHTVNSRTRGGIRTQAHLLPKFKDGLPRGGSDSKEPPGRAPRALPGRTSELGSPTPGWPSPWLPEAGPRVHLGPELLAQTVPLEPGGF